VVVEVPPPVAAYQNQLFAPPLGRAEILHGDCLELLQEIDSSSIDAVITDPPYAEIGRDYGRLSEPDWHALMRDVVRETRRVLKPQGSAVFILQPNSEHVGRMRTWVWEFLVEQAKDWNLIQDVYWWNNAALPNTHVQARYGLLRPSVKMCIWLGDPDCYRNQDAVLWSPSEASMKLEQSADWTRRSHPSGHTTCAASFARSLKERGNRVTPFNLLPLPNTRSTDSAGAYGHGAGTPQELCDWWTRYIVPDNGTALDPFCGSGSTGLAAVSRGKNWIGIEKEASYVEIARTRLNEYTALQ